MHILKTGIDSIVAQVSDDGGMKAARAILTTDLVEKSFAVKVKLSCGEITIGGIAKGSGMIMPNMATMLAFIATDTEIDNNLLQKMLVRSVNNSFNKITVDGDTSTNDMVVLIANGISGIRITEDSQDAKLFEQALQAISIDMAKAVVTDGEGATKMITVEVKGGQSVTDVDKIAQTIANSPLVKTAVYGSDANWGRIISAAGRSGVEFDPKKVEIKFNDMTILSPNFGHDFDEEEATVILSESNIVISVDLNDGDAKTTWWTCDFTEKYIEINASYRS